MSEQPFLSYYRANKISPVRQDISDLKAHFNRRRSLYTSLGLPAGLIRGKRVIEFGPGSGHNSVVTASYEPEKYVLVDGNPTGLESTKNFLSGFTGIQIIEADILGLELNEKFDILLAEGLVPLQNNPADFLRHISRCLDEGGLMIITTSDPVSFLSETLRRVIAHSISPSTDELSDRLKILCPVFESHASKLPGMTRPLEDWITDSLLIPFTGKLFSIAEAIDVVEDLDPLHTSPRFVSDWRWYKHMTGEDPGFKDAFRSSYWHNLHNFIDYRICLPPRDQKLNKDLFSNSEELFNLAMEFEKIGTLSPKFDEHLSKICISLNHLGLNEFKTGLHEFRKKGAFPSMPEFSGMFGRSMQYLSFVRRNKPFNH